MLNILRKLCLTILVLACASCGPSLDTRVEELVAAKNVWLSIAGERAYSYTLAIGEQQPYTVSVPNPRTLRDDWLDRLLCTGKFDCRATPTVRELFEFVLTLTDENLRFGGELIVRYDPEMGYPNYIFVDDRQGFHRAFSLKVSNVTFVSKQPN